jgi:uncharacterized membrane protein YhhN
VTGVTAGLLALTVVVALVDWIAVATENQRLVYVAKPATMVPLIGAACALDPAVPGMRWWFVGALAFSLAGDVFLMLQPPEKWFVAGLGSFLVGHLLYIIGFLHDDLSTTGVIIGAVVTFTALAAIGPTVVKGAADVEKALAFPVLVYMLTISVMVTLAFGTGNAFAIVGAVLFYVSDACIGWSRFVKDFPLAKLTIIVTYHVAQILLVLALV